MSQLFAHPSFIVMVLLLLAVALGFTLTPLLLGDPKQRSLRRRRRALEHLREELDPADYARRVANLEQERGSGKSIAPLPRGLIGLLLVSVPLLTFFLYTEVGAPEGLRPDTSVDAEMREMIGELAARVNSDPMDLESWNQIGMFWKSMRQFGIAEAAFRRVLFHEPDNSTAIVELAETLLFGSGQPHLPTEGWHLLEGLLEREPENQKALWLSGFNAMQLGDSASAIAYWSRLEVLLPEGSVKQQVQNQLRQARNMPMDDVHAGLLAAAGNDPETGAPDSAVGDPAEPTRAVAGQARADSEPAADAKAPAASTSVESGTSDPVTVEVDVSIAPELAQRLSGQETVFVFARAVNGPPAPLAVKRFSVRQLPTRVMLSEADAMAAGLTLATFPQVQIVARISRSGGVIANPGDIEGGTEPLDPRTTSRVAVVVDRIVGDG